MMTDSVTASDVVAASGVTHIKKEMESSGFAECSPSNSEMYSPTTTVVHDIGVRNFPAYLH